MDIKEILQGQIDVLTWLFSVTKSKDAETRNAIIQYERRLKEQLSQAISIKELEEKAFQSGRLSPYSKSYEHLLTLEKAFEAGRKVQRKLGIVANLIEVKNLVQLEYETFEDYLKSQENGK